MQNFQHNLHNVQVWPQVQYLIELNLQSDNWIYCSLWDPVANLMAYGVVYNSYFRCH